MGLFGRGKSGGLMNVIRCDQQDYLVWKWRPENQEVNSTSRENAIRYGSSLRVKDGEVAVFVYKQQNGTCQDFIEGPYDDTIKTDNFPVLSSIVGLAFGGESPFQAEIYFINLAGNNQMRFGIPYFDVFDPRFPDHGIPMSARGTLTFNVTDYKGFIKLNRLINFELEDFKKQVKDAISKYIKAVVMNVPSDMGIPAVQMERRILDINETVYNYLKPRMENDFGVNLKALDLGSLEIDKESPYYEELRQLTAGNTARTMNAQTDVNIQNLQDTQAINAQNMAETLRIQREEAQRAQQLQTQTNFMGTHAMNLQADVLKTGAQSLGTMGTLDGGSGGVNPAGMMTGMMMGGAMGQQMAGMMNGFGQAAQPQQQAPAMGGASVPPPMPSAVQYTVAINGQQYGPYNVQQMQQMAQSGQINASTLVWAPGMPQWAAAGSVPELAQLFMATPPPMPSVPPMPPTL